MKTQLIIKKQVLAVAAMVFGLACSASAGLVPVFTGETTTATTSTFTYSINFSSNGSTESLTAGDFFTLYDIGSVTSATSPGNFTRTQSLLGETAIFTAPPDSASILNLTNTYGGGTITADTTITETITFPGILTTTTGYYSSTDTIAIGKNSQAGLVTVPLIVVPEPSTCAALALGAALVGTAMMIRRRRSVA